MASIDYEALIEKRATREQIVRRKDAGRLAEIARNLESLRRIAEEQAKERAAGEPPDQDQDT